MFTNITKQVQNVLENSDVLDFYVWLDDAEPPTKRWVKISTEEEFIKLISTYLLVKSVNKDKDLIEIVISVNKDCTEEQMRWLQLLRDYNVVDKSFYFTTHNNGSDYDSISRTLETFGWKVF